jgi:hypothetical protein
MYDIHLSFSRFDWIIIPNRITMEGGNVPFIWITFNFSWISFSEISYKSVNVQPHLGWVRGTAVTVVLFTLSLPPPSPWLSHEPWRHDWLGLAVNIDTESRRHTVVGCTSFWTSPCAKCRGFGTSISCSMALWFRALISEIWTSLAQTLSEFQ